MKRSIWTMAITAAACAVVVLPALAAGPGATKSVVAGDEGISVVEISVTASGDAIYGVNIADASGSIKDIKAPKGWVGISSGDKVIFRTGDKPIAAGSSLSFRVYTTNDAAQLTLSFRDKDNPIAGGKTL